MEQIKDIVTGVMRGLKTQKKKGAADAPDILLKRLLLKKELPHVKFRYLRNGILGITVDSSGWIYQLNLRKASLLARLTGQPGSIKDIRFYLGDKR